jgi:peptide-methionine (R)-S-oxide reductase
MFDLDRGKEESNVSRRVFLAGAGAALGGTLLWSWRSPGVIAVAAKSEPGEVTIVQFSDEGKRGAKVKIARVVKTDEEWRKQLSPGAFDITRHADTEIAYTGKYWNLHDTGDLPLHLL